jgi:uncharacterized protein (DUF3820 family)
MSQLDDTPLRFGKYKGQTPKQVAEVDPRYVVWMRAEVLPAPCSRELALDCEARTNGAEVWR